MTWFQGFERHTIALDGVQVCFRTGGKKGAPALVLLHGAPQTHVMWHRVAQALQNDYQLVLPDLRGYGDSSHAKGEADHSTYSKRAMAKDIAGLMTHLGHEQFHICGHDRGGRVTHRLCLDHAKRVLSACMIDIAPTLDMYNATNMAFASAYYHWFHLIQPYPLPEKMIGGNPIHYLHTKLGGWGAKGLNHLEPQALAEYERCFSDETIHTVCEDYRASASIDLVHDRESRAKGEKIACKLRVLWGDQGVIQKMFEPITLWQAQCHAPVTGKSMPSGHFIPEELPTEIANELKAFHN